MDLPAALAATHLGLVTFTLIITRLSGLFLLGPVFGHPAVPLQIRVFLVATIGLVITPVINQVNSTTALTRYDQNHDGLLDTDETPPGLTPELTRLRHEAGFSESDPFPLADLPPGFLMPASLLDLIRQMTGELLIGLALGLGVLIWMSALQFAGYLIDQQTGVSLGEIFNPELDSSSSLSGELLYWLGTAVFLLIGGATLIIRTLIDSYLALPLGYALLPDATFELLWKLVGQSFVLVLQISAPVLTTMTLVALAMGLMSHTVPQLNVLIIGFPVRTIVGLAILLIALARMSERFALAFPEILDQLRQSFLPT